MDTVKLTQDFEDNFEKLICVSHNSGLHFWDILRVVVVMVPKLVMLADVEYYKNQQRGGKE